MNFREKLLQRIGDINDFGRPRPLVSLEEFFDGNDDYSSIGCNLPDQPSPAEFYRLFASIRDHPDVADVLVEVKDLEDPDGWPFTDTIWIITNAAPDDVHQWFADRFAPDEVMEGFPEPGSETGILGHKVEAYHVPHGMEAIGVWWD